MIDPPFLPGDMVTWAPQISKLADLMPTSKDLMPAMVVSVEHDRCVDDDDVWDVVVLYKNNVLGRGKESSRTMSAHYVKVL
jgi:hypothetical protein